MKASTQYNDYVGTSAADISDHIKLKNFLASQGVDINRYLPIGAGFYSSYADSFLPSIICIDSEHSTPEKPKVIKINVWDGELSREDFFNLFKRMDVEFTTFATSFRANQRHGEPESIDIRDLRESDPEE